MFIGGFWSVMRESRIVAGCDLPMRTSLVLILVRGVYIIVACTLICFEWRFYCAGSKTDNCDFVGECGFR